MNKHILTIQWHITEKCNNNCRHCYMERLNNDLSLQQLELALDKILNFESQSNNLFVKFTLTGGDPLQFKDWEKFARSIVKKGKQLSFLGNPELLNDNTLSILKDLNIDSYQLSLDGLEDTHDYIRSPGSFKRTIDAIHKLQSWEIPIHIMFTLSKTNENELIPLIDYLDSLDVPLNFAFDFLVQIGNANDGKLPFSNNINTIFAAYLSKKSELQSKNSKVVLLEKSSYFLPYKFKHGLLNFDFYNDFSCDICSGCGATWQHFTILNNGDVCICRRMPIIIGNIIQDNLEDIFSNNSIVSDFRNKDAYAKCGTCIFYQFCRGCPAVFKALSGDYHGNDIDCPYYTKQNDKIKAISHSQPTILKDEFYNNRDNLYTPSYVKALVILGLAGEREQMQTDINLWLKKHKLDLTEHQIKVLKYGLMHL